VPGANGSLTCSALHDHVRTEASLGGVILGRVGPKIAHSPKQKKASEDMSLKSDGEPADAGENLRPEERRNRSFVVEKVHSSGR
jgi:hypothetical protein